MENEKEFGKLFDNIILLDENHLQTILDTMDSNHAKYILVQAVKYAFHNGIYSLGEAEVISKCIRVLSNSNECH